MEHLSAPEAPATFQHRAWADIPLQSVADGIARQMIWGDRLMVCRLRFDPGIVTPVHSHPHEQITIVERGRVRFTIAGREHVVTAGDVLTFASGVEHGATMLDEDVVLIDIFSPIREEFLQATPPLRQTLASAADGPPSTGH